MAMIVCVPTMVVGGVFWSRDTGGGVAVCVCVFLMFFVLYRDIGVSYREF